MLDIIKRIDVWPFQIGGVEHSGWLPSEATTPLPTPIHVLVLEIEIHRADSGFLLCYSSQDGSFSGDTWHCSLEEAERAATELFGVKQSDWRSL